MACGPVGIVAAAGGCPNARRAFLRSILLTIPILANLESCPLRSVPPGWQVLPMQAYSLHGTQIDRSTARMEPFTRTVVKATASLFRTFSLHCKASLEYYPPAINSQ